MTQQQHRGLEDELALLRGAILNLVRAIKELGETVMSPEANNQTGGVGGEDPSLSGRRPSPPIISQRHNLDNRLAEDRTDPPWATWTCSHGSPVWHTIGGTTHQSFDLPMPCPEWENR